MSPRPCLRATAAGLLALGLVVPHVSAQTVKPRARDLGVPFDGTPGRYNAITDVAGVEVGHTTLIRGDGPLVVGETFAPGPSISISLAPPE